MSGSVPEELMQLTQAPRTFCWTKIEAEMGEDLATTVLRKEWERRLGGGRFLWGVGQQPSGSARLANQRGASTLALFSPKSSANRARKSRRADMLLWNAWIDVNGQVRPLPSHVLIPSSTRLPSGKRREHYYALVCSSPQDLRIGHRLSISPGNLAHYGSGKRLGAATATAIVEFQPDSGAECARKRYPVAFAVALATPLFVKLAQPTLIKARDFAQLQRASREGDFETYVELVRRLRAGPSIERASGFTRDLFESQVSEATTQTEGFSRQAAKFVASVIGRHQVAPQLALF